MRRLTGIAAIAAVVTSGMIGSFGAASPATAAPTAPAGSLPAGSQPTALTEAAAGSAGYIVLAAPGAEAAAEAAVLAAGGTVTKRLGLVNGFAAKVPGGALAALGRNAAIRSVTPNATVRPMSSSTTTALGYDAADTGSLSAITQIVGAQSAWASGYTGKGVDVAVIDTGVTRVAGLDATGKVIDGPDLSLDSPSADLYGLDAFGHGTFMAGIIAGRDAGVGTSRKCSTCLSGSNLLSDTSKYVGVAPDSRIINVKVGAADGATDVTQVIAALDWVVQHAHDTGFNIKVVNLSFGTNATQAYTVDPLAQAAEQAWKHGVVVVAAAGNEGLATQSLANPAYDPYLIAVGASDPMGTLETSDDKVASFAQHGNKTRTVDVVAPGAHLIGLRVPGSFVDTLTSNTGQVATRFQRGSGTSEATAVVTGMVALLAQKFPKATPDQLKGMLSRTATPLPLIKDSPELAQLAAALKMTTAQCASYLNTLNSYYSGNGIALATEALGQNPADYPAQNFAAAAGTGTLDGARGGVYLVDNGVSLSGQVDIFGQPYDSAVMAAAQSAGTAWSGGVWNGSRWSGDSWAGSRWSGAVWSGADWAGSRWSGSRWSGQVWDGSRWSGAGWSGSRWSGGTWSGSRWSSSDWA